MGFYVHFGWVSSDCLIVPADKEGSQHPIGNSRQKHSALIVAIGPLFCWDSELCAQPKQLCKREGNVIKGSGRCFCTVFFIQSGTVSVAQNMTSKTVYRLVAPSSEAEEISHTLAIGALTSMLRLCSNSGWSLDTLGNGSWLLFFLFSSFCLVLTQQNGIFLTSLSYKVLWRSLQTLSSQKVQVAQHL